MVDMEESLQGLDLTQLAATVSDGFINLEEGTSSPFLSIPSTSELLTWSEKNQRVEVFQSSEGFSVVGTKGLGLGSTDPVDFQVAVKLPTSRSEFFTEGFTSLSPGSGTLPSSFFDDIANKDTEADKACASNADDNQMGAEWQQVLGLGSKEKASKKSKLSKSRERGRLLVFGEGICMDKAL